MSIQVINQGAVQEIIKQLDETPKKNVETAKEVALDALNFMMTECPVDSGLLRSGFRISLDAPSGFVPDNPSGKDVPAGQALLSILQNAESKLNGMKDAHGGRRIIIENNVEYASIALETGSETQPAKGIVSRAMERANRQIQEGIK